MGNSNACKNIPKIDDCIDSKEVDFQVVDVRKKFIKSKNINRKEMDNKFYNKVESNKNFKDKNNLFDLTRRNEFYNKSDTKHSREYVYPITKVKSNTNKTYEYNNNETFINKSSRVSFNEAARFEREIKSKGDFKREYFNGSIKVVLFQERKTSKNTITELTD